MASTEPKVELLMPEFGEALGRFEIIDFAPKEEIDESGATIARQRYRLQPARSGTQIIPPLRIEFVDRERLLKIFDVVDRKPVERSEP